MYLCVCMYVETHVYRYTRYSYNTYVAFIIVKFREYIHSLTMK